MNEPSPDSDRDSEPPLGQRATRVVFQFLVYATAGVTLLAFTLSFIGLRDYGIRVEHLNPWLAPLVPLTVDVFSLCGMAATYVVRHDRIRRRVYAWFVFLIPAALSVAGNLAHGEARGLDIAGLVGAAAPPVVLALAAHLLVFARRSTDRGQLPVARPAVSAGPETVQVSEPVPLSADPEPEQPKRPHNATPDEVRQYALNLVHQGGISVEDAAAAVGKNPRTVQRWLKDEQDEIRARSRKPRPAATGDSDRGQPPTAGDEQPDTDQVADVDELEGAAA
jgi:transposase-like protein